MSFIDENTIIIDGLLPMYLKESFLRKKLIEESYVEGLMELGWGNGYVGLPKWHPWFNIHYNDIYVDVHGGLTFSEFNKDYPVENDNLWWLGFDCAHCNDAPDINEVENPEVRAIHLSFPREGIIRTLEYCIEQCELMSQQLKEVE